MPAPQATPVAPTVFAEAAAMLDNPIWHSLRTGHAALALGDERARRYPSHIGPLSGIPAQDPLHYAALAALAPEDIVVLFSVDPFRVPERWTQLRILRIVQMVRPADAAALQLGDTANMRPLTAADAPQMVALAELTEPGPFRLRTLELGGFYGIFEGDRLLSMAGRRMHLPGLIEVSGVCTHPDARGRGYAALLMSRVIEEIEREGKTAFLHAIAGNPAIRIYDRLGFALRKTLHCAVLKPGL
ncbi:MAG TPA: GNAT family N-acetyltransferase [Terracidiphilus sp.]|jgi:GNAT superfamily N-acetyltransferase|nr:GNAT family N-acetyltransferase [Terracidiphilus sp.]